MVQLVIKNGIVIAWHDVDQHVDATYPDAETVEWEGSLDNLQKRPDGHIPDPRTEEQRLEDARQRYRRRRRAAYPHPLKLLLMIYQDQKNGTTKFVDTIDAIHDQFKSDA